MVESLKVSGLAVDSSNSSSHRPSWLVVCALMASELVEQLDLPQARSLNFLVIQPFKDHLPHHQNHPPYEWYVCVPSPPLHCDLSGSATSTTTRDSEKVLMESHIYSLVQVDWNSIQGPSESSWTLLDLHLVSNVATCDLASLSYLSVWVHIFDRCNPRLADQWTPSGLIDLFTFDWSLTRHRHGHLWTAW